LCNTRCLAGHIDCTSACRLCDASASISIPFSIVSKICSRLCGVGVIRFNGDVDTITIIIAGCCINISIATRLESKQQHAWNQRQQRDGRQTRTPVGIRACISSLRPRSGRCHHRRQRHLPIPLHGVGTLDENCCFCATCNTWARIRHRPYHPHHLSLELRHTRR
jgi:hypothetical protein